MRSGIEMEKIPVTSLAIITCLEGKAAEGDLDGGHQIPLVSLS